MNRSIKLLSVFAALSAAALSVFASTPTMHKSAYYNAGQFNTDGGVMEIIAYNSTNGYAYAVNGQSGLLTALDLNALSGNGSDIRLSGSDIDVKAIISEYDPDFDYGDMTSVAVSPDGTLLAVALQAEDYADKGYVAVFDCQPDGSVVLRGAIGCGVQPDMIVFADNNTILTADEGEPRAGYGEGIADPAGSVSIINVDSLSSAVVGFEDFDSESSRNALIEDRVILMKNSLPSVDFEPEYIAISGGKAYITLQEANAIASLDIAEKKFDGIWSAGFEDYSAVPVDIDKSDDAYDPKTYDSLSGIRMPDGIAAFSIDGTTYLVTANEGDAREWGDEDSSSFYLNEDERDFGEGESSPAGLLSYQNTGIDGKVVFFRSDDYEGLDENMDYIFGGRTFTVYAVQENGLAEVFSSRDDFEAITAELYPEFFNTSNDNAVLDDRSGKKGPEPESVTTGFIDGRCYAFIALERTGGVMMYDVTVPEQSVFVDYLNPRDFRSVIAGSEAYDDGELDKWVTGGDVAPEGLAFINADVSPTGKTALLVANEVSGTVSYYEIY